MRSGMIPRLPGKIKLQFSETSEKFKIKEKQNEGKKWEKHRETTMFLYSEIVIHNLMNFEKLSVHERFCCCPLQ